MSLTIAAEAPPLTVLENGAVRVTGTRMPLELLIRAHTVRGLSAEQIVREHAPLELADVYAVLGYYHRHRAEVEQYLAESDARAEQWRRKFEELRGPQPTRTELLKRRAFRAGEFVPAGGFWRCRETGEEAELTHGDRFPTRDGDPETRWDYVGEPAAIPAP